MSHDYTENVLVQGDAAHLLETELGWNVQYAYNTEVLGKDGTLGRESNKQVLLTRYFRKALLDLNPWITPAQLDEAQKAMESRLSTASPMQINEEKYYLIRDGIPVTAKRADGKNETKRAAVIDFRNPQNNHFLAVQELWVYGDTYHCRPDIVGFVNGIPLLFMEFKNTDVDIRDAYDGNYRDYLANIPQLFYYNAFLIMSNGLEARVGTLGSKWSFFHEWKRLKESDAGNAELNTMLRGICKMENLLDLLECFILFDHSGGHTAKILARNHQYLGVNQAIRAYDMRKINNGRLGVFWHTQGSGKSYSMAFMAQKIRRIYCGSPTFVVLTDRDELNRQISDTFENCGLLGKAKASSCIAKSSTDLIRKLQGNPSFIFTLIQKFNKNDVEPIHADHDIIIMSDEAHRSQYGVFAANMMQLLPDASRIGFTGTPLFSDDEITRRTFGDYVSIYNFKRAVEDGATVPLYYENRGEKIKDLENPEITERILDAIERADLDDNMRERLEADFAKEIHIMTAEPRLRQIARDFAGHYSDLWTSGKAMFVCLNKITCVRMYNFVQEYWQKEIEALRKKLRKAGQQEAQELERRIKWMEETEMAVVISQDQNEVRDFAEWELDIKPHREKMQKRELDKEFKDPDNPFRVVFVCAMWLTGFDVPSLATMYVYKPMHGYNLMQAIARVNRVFKDKEGGLVVDYVGIASALKAAMNEYTARDRSRYGDMNIAKTAYPKFQEKLQVCKDLFHGFDWSGFIGGTPLVMAKLISGGANFVLNPRVQNRKDLYLKEALLMKQALSLCSSMTTEQERREAAYFEAVRATVVKLTIGGTGGKTLSLMEINAQINELLKASIQSEGVISLFDSRSVGEKFSLFDPAVLEEISKMKEKNIAVEILKKLMAEQVALFKRTNVVQSQKFSEMITKLMNAYYNGLITNEEVIKELLDAAKQIAEACKIGDTLGLTQEELAFYDALTKPAAIKDFYENDTLVQMTRELTELLRKNRTIDWQKKETARATMRKMVKRLLKKYKYPPEEYEDAIETVISQCEMWTDNVETW